MCLKIVSFLNRSAYPVRTFLLAGILAVGCGEKDTSVPSPDPVLMVSPSALHFDDTDPSKNKISVESNGSWMVRADAGVVVVPVRGEGSGSFTVTDAPAGISSRLTVSMGTLSRGVTITRDAETGAPALDLSPASLEFDPLDPGHNRISVSSDAAWSVTGSDAGLTFTPASGEGDGEIIVTGAPENKPCILTVTAEKQGKKRVREVTVTYTVGVRLTDIYYDDFDKTPSYSGWANRSDEWKNPTGPGASGVTYHCAQAYVRNDSNGTAGRYEGASGRCYMRIFFDGNPYFTVGNIALSGQTDLTLSLGCGFTAANCTIEVSADGSYWKELTYTGASAYNVWESVSVGFTLSEPVEKLFVRFTPVGTAQYGVNIDDLRLSSGGGGERVSLIKPQFRWAELPGNFERPEADQFVYTHRTRTVTSGQEVRNYTYCYDTRRHNPVWVAYPLHACYAEGGYGRTNPDPWTADPALDASLQSKIYGFDASDLFQYWTYDWAGGGTWSKGHLCMSRERGGANQQINMQTFYPTNIAPQPTAPSTFGTIWGHVESLFSGTRNQSNNITADDGPVNINIVSDTLYLVAGCYYEHDRWVERDASNWGNLSPESKDCIMPTHQFKMGLRTKTGNTGKPISECSAGELQAVAFWIGTTTTDPADDAELYRFAVPVSFVEQKTGITFFPDVPASVKENFDRTEWGF